MYKLIKFIKKDGTFDYQAYVTSQVAANKRKKYKVWAIESNIAFLADRIRMIVANPRFGLCHGTRHGDEQSWFTKYLHCHVLGTEISDNATQYANTIQWDFHNVKPEWVDTVDFIYSNSFDHTYDPKKCLNAWMSCVRKPGVCILEHSNMHSEEGVKTSDPFGADITVMPYLIAMWSGGKYGVSHILPAPAMRPALRYQYFIFIQRF